MLLKDKIVVVSGIGPGLGVKLAEEAAREGAAGLVIAARTAAKLDDAEARVRAINPACTVLKCVTDIADRRHCDALAAAALKRFGRVDALVNSAFVHGEMDHASTADLDGWRAVFDTNLLGTLKLTQALIPALSVQGGAVVMINTMAVRKVPPLGEAGYAASKAALATSVKYLATELGSKRIRVNTVHMGWMWGAPVQGYVAWQAGQLGISEDAIKAQIAANIPLGFIPPDEDCAKAALFMVSDHARVITGASLDVNGGAWMP
ncbi:MAG: SDR family oxidoreductase [Gammaproteobacteria bacterium]|nr:SDR family oxidoreductase [Gammaproteobacteria bacterium]